MARPKVSIGLPVYNGETFLCQALDAILAQDFADFELVICDNASTDSTEAVCREYASRDPRIVYHRNETNIGSAPNHCRVFHLSQGHYFKWAAHDDVMLPGMLARCVDELEAAPPEVVLVYPRIGYIDAAGRPTVGNDRSLETRHRRPHQRLYSVLSRVVQASALFGLFRPEMLRQTRLEDSFESSDIVLLAEIAMLGQIREIPEILFQRRLHEGISTRANKTRAQWRAWNDPKKRGRGIMLPLREMLVLEYLRSAWRLPLRPLDRLLCLGTAPAAVYWRALRIAEGKWRSRGKRTSSTDDVTGGTEALAATNDPKHIRGE